jgi:hypothetical protein
MESDKLSKREIGKAARVKFHSAADMGRCRSSSRLQRDCAALSGDRPYFSFLPFTSNLETQPGKAGTKKDQSRKHEMTPVKPSYLFNRGAFVIKKIFS